MGDLSSKLKEGMKATEHVECVIVSACDEVRIACVREKGIDRDRERVRVKGK